MWLQKQNPPGPPYLEAGQADSAPGCGEGEAHGENPRPPLTLPLPFQEAVKSGVHRTVHAGEVGPATVVKEVSVAGWWRGPSPRSPHSPRSGGPRWAPRCMSAGRGHTQDREAGARLPHPGGCRPLQQAAAGKHALRGEGPGRGGQEGGAKWGGARGTGERPVVWGVARGHKGAVRGRGGVAEGLIAAGSGRKPGLTGLWDSATRLLA